MAEAIQRTYSVYFQAATLPVGLFAWSIPLSQFGLGDVREGDLAQIVGSLLDARIEEYPAPSDDAELVSMISTLVFRYYDTYERFSDSRLPRGNSHDVIALAEAMVKGQFVPVEASPLSGTGLSDLVKTGSLMGFATFGELYGLTHHDPALIVATPLVVVVIGAAVGAGEGLRERMRRVTNPGSPRSRRKKPS